MKLPRLPRPRTGAPDAELSGAQECSISVPSAGAGLALPPVAALALIAAAALAPLADAAQSDQLPTSHGLSYMTAFGPKNYPVVTQLQGVIAISLIVVTVVGVLVLVGSIARRARPSDGRLASVPLERSGRGLSLIYVGTAISFVVLLGTAVWGYVVLAEIAGPRGQTVATVRITGHQWWWEVDYQSPEPSRNFKTANELHIPVGQPVRIELLSADVIHSFWVPALTGKMDLIPSQRNVTWIQADTPGVYRGQCVEYCGQQHAHMAFLTVAQSPADFEAWWQHQLQPAEPTPAQAATPAVLRGSTTFIRHCAVCHAIRGTSAQGRIGPDLSHLMERRTIAAGTLPNTIGYLSGWISNPQHIKPGNRMPTLTLSAQELDDLRAYLSTLQ